MFYPKIGNLFDIPDGAETATSYQKYDGSNIGFTWDKKKGWTKIQSRNQYIDKTHSLGHAIELFHDEYANQIPTSKLRAKYFMEYFGPNSFAGSHQLNDNMEMRLFDVALNDVLIAPKMFDKHFGHLPFAAKNLGRVILTPDYFEDIRNSVTLGEGVVLKGKHERVLWRAKVKTNAYMDKLKNFAGDSWKDFWE